MPPIPVTGAYLLNLCNLIEPEEVLQKHGYVVRPLTDDELLLKKRCLGCNKMMSQLRTQKRKCDEPSAPGQMTEDWVGTSLTAPQLLMSASSVPFIPGDLPVAVHPANFDPKKTPPIICRFHEGPVVNKYCTSCNQLVTSQACGGSLIHNPASTPLHQLQKQYQFHSTPIHSSSKKSFRSGVSIDCEMGTTVSGDSEVIRITLIDYFSGEVLIDNIVQPYQRLEHLKTRFSGVTWAEFNKAIRQHTALKDKAGARHAIWQFVGPETVVVGHGASNDLRALRWIHPVVVDSYVIEFEFRKRMGAAGEAKKAAAMESKDDVEPIEKKCDAALVEIEVSQANSQSMAAEVPVKKSQKKKEPGSLSLKALVKKRLGRDIQMGKKGHDSLEDAVAARDLVHWYLSNPNQDFW